MLFATKNKKAPLLESLIEHFPLPMFYKNADKSNFITNSSFDQFAGTNRSKILNAITNMNIKTSTKIELKLKNDLDKEIDTITYVSEVDEGTLGVIVDITDQIEAKNAIHSLKDRYETATKATNEGLWDWDLVKKEAHFSNKFKEVMGITTNNVKPIIESWMDRIDPRDKSMVLKELEKYVNQEINSFKQEHRIKIHGKTRWVSISGKATFDEKKRPTRMTGFITDITDIKEAQIALKDSEEQFSLFMRNLPAGAFIKDEKGEFVFSNNYFNKLLGKGNLTNLKFYDVMPSSSITKVQESDRKTIQDGSDTLEDMIKTADGDEKYFHIHKFLINKDDKQYIGGIYSDITEQKKTQDKLNKLAHFDTLTSLPNRMMFQNSLKTMLSRANRNQTKVALMFIDLDNFKMINDTLGHDYGDLLLQEVATRLKKTLRAEDAVSRLGGDEFTIILDDIKDVSYPSIVAQKIIDALSTPIKLKDEMGYIGASVGISIFPDDTPELEQLIKNADLAMYKAKKEGKNIYRYFTEDMTADASEKLELTNDLRSSIENDQLVLYYQPIIDTRDNTISSFEALVRWEHPKYGLITPEHFIPLAEDGGLMVKIGKYIIKKACQQIKAIENSGHDIKIAVNISSKQLTQNHLEETVKAIVKESGIKPTNLELEVTESFLMDNIEEVDKTISNLKDIGINTAIDDFGTGYSSLSRLKKLSISKLKIDKSFIDDIPHDNDDMVITNMIITLAKQLGLDIVAEGVETKEQLEFLKEKECFLMQGYHFSEAISQKHLNEFINKNS
jgi:diguanylate cyclase (GGDEF)-like protein/PAS domain S-box-containing protein